MPAGAEVVAGHQSLSAGDDGHRTGRKENRPGSDVIPALPMRSQGETLIEMC